MNASRAGIVASATFLLGIAASSASPAFAIGTPTPAVGQSCTSLQDAILQPLNLVCVGGVVTTIASQVTTPPPTTVPAPAPSSSTSPAPNPLGGITKTVTNTVTGVVGGVTSGGTSVLPGTPTTSGLPAPGTSPSTSPTGSAQPTSSGSTQPRTSGTAGTVDGSSLLGPAAAFLPGSAVASFADLASGYLTPLADAIPLPELAGPDQKLAAVQAPLIAAGDQASKQADSILARFGGKALPGLLVVLATGMVAAVGAGNLHAWQARIADKRARVAGS